MAPVTPAETLEIYAFMEAADESKRQNGAEVKLADVMAKAFEREGMKLTHLIGPKTGHAYHKETKVELNKLIDAIEVETDAKKRDGMLREALVITRDQYYYVPLHHQLRPWAMKRNVTTVHKADDRPESRFVKID